MAIVFGVRGDSIDARYSNGGKLGVKNGNTGNITINVDAAYLSGSNIQFAGATAAILSWAGRYNTPNGRAISMLHRHAPMYTGSPASSRVLIPGVNIGPDRMGRIEVTHNTSGNIIVTVVNELGTVCINAVSAGAFSPVSGTINDVAYSWDGTTTANSFKVYVDASLIGTGITPTAAMSASMNNTWYSTIVYGNASTSSLSVSKTDEFYIFDTAIDFTANITLNSGAGLANGAARTSLVSCAVLDGALYTVPADSDIRSGTAVVRAGVSSTGTLDLPAISNVKNTVVFDNTTKTGTYCITTGSSSVGG